MLYLLDANVLITANDTYYPVNDVPEFWAWLLHNAGLGNVKIPLELMEEIKAGHQDPLLDWIAEADHEQTLLLNEQVDPLSVRRVVDTGYANDLTDVEVESLGRDPFLIAYALADQDRCVVTIEASSPSKRRQNRKIPDVCDTMHVQHCDPFKFYRALNFRTSWRP